MDTAEQLALQKLLAVVDTYRATDLHLSVGNPPMMRVAGKLAVVPEQPLLTPAFMERVVGEWLDEDDKKVLAEKKEVTIAKTFSNKKRFRISVFYQQGHLSAALMIIPARVPGLDQLSLPPAAQRLVNMQSGLVLVIGPYGARQSVTVASFLEYLNHSAQKHIVTIEKPVEFLFTDDQCVIDQREVGKDLESVSQGLDFLLEQDVDVVMVTDLAERTALQKALQLANAGKAVFAVLNVNTIDGALDHFIHSFEGVDQNQARSELASSLQGVINQRSITSLTGDKITLAEVMIPNDSVRNIIRKGELSQIITMMASATGEDGMVSLDMAIQAAITNGMLSRQDAARIMGGSNKQV